MKAYNRVLLQLTERHRMFCKMAVLQKEKFELTPVSFNLKFNQWDREMSELMHSAEDASSKFKNNEIEFSPIVSLWLNRLRIYRHIRRFKLGAVPDPRNLFEPAHEQDFHNQWKSRWRSWTQGRRCASII